MTTETTATVVDGGLKLDVPLDLPNETRVRVAIIPDDSERDRRKQLWKEFLEYMNQHPVDSGGRRFTRDELYDHI
ncbi:MAG: hypothetical protein DWQ34_18515 [Planctomycetota bacterium]|nr:MAG: hypothetical protein DWQ34_18515 [Planctomycetota bacterium]REJ97260.1 MAG: hypothetical protein DWQ29_00215 [Planctomycetota bacterium]REK22227.1 MAG: hypothetical protein DWQ41_19615 [Planctomycetota bacterium]